MPRPTVYQSLFRPMTQVWPHLDHASGIVNHDSSSSSIDCRWQWCRISGSIWQQRNGLELRQTFRDTSRMHCELSPPSPHSLPCVHKKYVSDHAFPGSFSLLSSSLYLCLKPFQKPASQGSLGIDHLGGLVYEIHRVYAGAKDSTWSYKP